MQENAAQRYIQADVAPPDLAEVDWKGKPLPFKLYRNCEQISLGRGQIGQMLGDIYGLTRQSHSVPMFHPMLKSIPKEGTGGSLFYTSLLRPVPSGGALFPCELYLLVAETTSDTSRRNSGLQSLRASYNGQEHCLPAGIYHYDAVHHALDVLGRGDYSSLLQSALAHPGETPAAYTLLLSSYFWKDGFKYGAFSYRLQGLDIGTVISQNEIITHHVGLATTIHYQFQDKAINDLLGLDPLHESVYAVIEWRHEENKAGLQEAGASLVPTRLVGGDHGQGQATVPTRFGTINARALERNKTSPRPATESITRWPLPEEIHRASLIKTREAFRPLHSLAPIQLPQREEDETLPLEASTHLDLWEARSKRRSAVGTFLPTPLTKQQFSQLLRTSMHGTANDLDGHTAFLQHTLLYCVVHRVKGVPAGIYRYRPEWHALELVHAGGMRPYEIYPVLRTILNLFYASVDFFPVGNYVSGFQVYGDRWYRMQNMEAGIIAQRLYLAAAAQNLGCRASLSFVVPAINELLGLSDAKADANQCQHTSLMHITVAPERTAHQYYEQSLII